MMAARQMAALWGPPDNTPPGQSPVAYNLIPPALADRFGIAIPIARDSLMPSIMIYVDPATGKERMWAFVIINKDDNPVDMGAWYMLGTGSEKAIYVDNALAASFDIPRGGPLWTIPQQDFYFNIDGVECVISPSFVVQTIMCVPGDRMQARIPVVGQPVIHLLGGIVFEGESARFGRPHVLKVVSSDKSKYDAAWASEPARDWAVGWVQRLWARSEQWGDKWLLVPEERRESHQEMVELVRDMGKPREYPGSQVNPPQPPPQPQLKRELDSEAPPAEKALDFEGVPAKNAARAAVKELQELPISFVFAEPLRQIASGIDKAAFSTYAKFAESVSDLFKQPVAEESEVLRAVRETLQGLSEKILESHGR
jgi:hypothetical protein